MDNIIKSPIERISVYFGFLNNMAAGETISTVVITCVNSHTGVSTIETIVSGYAILFPDIRVVLELGTEDEEHSVSCVVTTSLGNSFQRDLLLIIKSAISDTFTKQPSDAFLIEVDFTRRLESADSIYSSDALAIMESDGSSASVVSGTSFVSPFVGVPVHSGIDGKTYRISARATTIFGYVYEKFIRMNVQEF